MKQKKLIPDKPIKVPFKRKKKKIKPKGLTKKQTRFCHEYVIDHNGTQAAIRAGYSKDTAQPISGQLLKIIKVQELIKELDDKIHAKLEITAERTLLEIARLAYFNPQKMFNAEGKLIPIHKLDKDTAACIGGIDVYQKFVGESKEACMEAIKKFKIWDKNSTLEKMAKYFAKTFENAEDEDKPVSKRMFFQVVDASKSDQDDKEDE